MLRTDRHLVLLLASANIQNVLRAPLARKGEAVLEEPGPLRAREEATVLPSWFTPAIEAHQGMKGWIVDLRGNTGGGYDRSLKTLIKKLGRKVAVIIDAGSVSAAETFSRDLVNVCKARVFGARTAG